MPPVCKSVGSRERNVTMNCGLTLIGSDIAQQRGNLCRLADIDNLKHLAGAVIPADFPVGRISDGGKMGAGHMILLGQIPLTRILLHHRK